MNIYKLFSISVILVVLLTSCSDFFISDVDRKNLPDTKPMLVIKSFMSPEDSIVTVAVAKSHPLFTNDSWANNSDDLIKNAIVTLSQGNNRFVLAFNEHSLRYLLPNSESNLKIIPGETYKIEVSAPGFDPVSSFTTVPVSVPQTTGLCIIDTVYLYNEGEDRIRFTFSFTDAPNEVNFYSAKLNYDIINHDGIHSLYEFSPKEKQISDEENDGKLLNISFLFDKSNWVGGFPIDSNAVFTIYSYDEPTWLYNVGLIKLGNSDEGNPFSEPIIVFSNITNGRGIFGSYRKVCVPVKLKK